MAAPSHPDRSRSGLTLVELLVSIAIAAVVVTLIVSLYRTVALTVSGQQARARGPHAAAQALDVIRADLTATILPAEDPSCVFTLGPALADGASGLELGFCALLRGDEEHGLLWSQPYRVTFRVAAVAGHTAALVRVSAPLSGPDALAGPQTNVLLGDVAQFAVTVFDGQDWLAGWPPADPKAPRPALVRVALVPREAGGRPEGYSTEILVPAGLSITSAITRVSENADAGAPPAPEQAPQPSSLP